MDVEVSRAVQKHYAALGKALPAQAPPPPLAASGHEDLARSATVWGLGFRVQGLGFGV